MAACLSWMAACMDSAGHCRIHQSCDARLPFHTTQFHLKQVPYLQAPQLDAAAEPEAVASGIKDKGIAEKLAAAARRRRERLAKQPQQQEKPLWPAEDDDFVPSGPAQS